ncbi:MAG TPA: calcium/sodium antiporter [Planctomycetota bacterium]|nr:calcium/sodium antiporter [Planctomycetota bacterium]
MTANTALQLLLGLTALILGAQFLVKGASKLALALGISPLIVGLTVVAFGTSAPELAVSAQSALSGQTNVVLGNVVGSNIYNVLFILGLCALITPLVVAPQLIRIDVPIMIGASLVLYLLALDGTISRADGALLAAGIAAYILFVIRQARRERQAVQEAYADELKGSIKPDRRYWLHALFIVIGLVFLGLGSDWLVEGAVAVATAFKLSPLLIGMTVVTVGTTAPEMTACLVASARGEKDIAVGNIVGSNIFNILAVLGTGGVLSPTGIPVDATMIGFGLPVMVAVAVACLPVFFTGAAIRRWEGAMFVTYFCVYTSYLVLEAMKNEASGTVRVVVIWLMLPLTMVTLGTSTWREWKKRKGGELPSMKNRNLNPS